ncbi:hypothetical protein DN390_28750 [Bacillus sp. SH7-1]|nr:hypothetical protein DN390_28750 [Bacillus sp. SH7-1]
MRLIANSEQKKSF